MGKHSQRGPIDPQLVAPGWQHQQAQSAGSSSRRRRSARTPSLLGAWMPILQQHGPAVIQAAEALALRVVREWLQQYMFSAASDASARAEAVAGVVCQLRTPPVPLRRHRPRPSQGTGPDHRDPGGQPGLAGCCAKRASRYDAHPERPGSQDIVKHPAVRNPRNEIEGDRGPRAEAAELGD
jgi:hypothetical protein